MQHREREREREKGRGGERREKKKTYSARVRGKDAHELEEVQQQGLGEALEDGGAVEVLAVLVALVGVGEQAAHALVLEAGQVVDQLVGGAEEPPAAVGRLGRRLQVAQLPGQVVEPWDRAGGGGGGLRSGLAPLFFFFPPRFCIGLPRLPQLLDARHVLRGEVLPEGRRRRPSGGYGVGILFLVHGVCVAFSTT